MFFAGQSLPETITFHRKHLQELTTTYFQSRAIITATNLPNGVWWAVIPLHMVLYFTVTQVFLEYRDLAYFAG